MKTFFVQFFNVMVFLIFLFPATSASAGEFPGNYLAADTEKALEILKSVSDAELQTAFEQYKAGKSIQEKRMLKLAEEYLSREADRVASERLKFLSAATMALLILFFALVFWIIRNQIRIMKRLDEQ